MNPVEFVMKESGLSRIQYRAFNIQKNMKPIPDRRHDWDFWHDDYDGVPDSADCRAGTAASEEDCKALIDEYWAELTASAY